MDLSVLFYPKTCPFCGKYISDYQVRVEHTDWICMDCFRKLPRTEQDLTADNSTEMALLDGASSLSAARKTMHLVHAWAFLHYEKQHLIRHVIHRMKYSDQPELGYWMGWQAVMSCRNEDLFDGIDVIIPMPLHPKRLRERGYNQSEYIARGISEVTGIPIDTTHVQRIRNTPKQALQDGEGRKTNVAGAFAVNHPEQMYHKHILVVDDLVTTGETVKACLHAMRAFRGARFSVFALCKAQ
jgi:ComF family protein